MERKREREGRRRRMEEEEWRKKKKKEEGGGEIYLGSLEGAWRELGGLGAWENRRWFPRRRHRIVVVAVASICAHENKIFADRRPQPIWVSILAVSAAPDALALSVSQTEVVSVILVFGRRASVNGTASDSATSGLVESDLIHPLRFEVFIYGLRSQSLRAFDNSTGVTEMTLQVSTGNGSSSASSASATLSSDIKSASLIGRLTLADDGIPWRILQGVDHQEGYQMGPSLGSTFYDFCRKGRIFGKLHQMSHPCLSVCQVLFFHAILASKFVCLFAGPFRRWILGHVVQVSHPDVLPANFEHSLLAPGLAVWMGGLVTTAELATQRSSFSSAFLMAFLQMRRPQHHSFQARRTRVSGVNSSICELNTGTTSQLDGERSVPEVHSAQNERWGLRMVGEWMMDPIKIPWFRRPGSSWSLVYLVRGGSRPNLTEGSLSAAMGCVVQGYLIDLG
ncbi:hypothetical protein M5K25_021974 [Dendrobium thyrsiflorum]|uniref:Uncharacterized protein n=1 Tax=Dendrobium thyrsiflorum TaxID=117978 RepID=A0ABD0UBJ1_DENTH